MPVIDIRVFVASLDEDFSPELARIGIQQSWHLRRLPAAAQAILEIRQARPCVVVVQVPLWPHETLKLLQWMRSGLASIASIAAAISHTDEIERAVRTAGASCYLPDAMKNGLLERVVTDMLATRGRAAAVATSGEARRSKQDNLLLSSSFSKTTRAAGLTFPPPSLSRGAEGVHENKNGRSGVIAARRLGRNNLLLSSSFSKTTRAAGLTFPPPSLSREAEGVHENKNGRSGVTAARRLGRNNLLLSSSFSKTTRAAGLTFPPPSLSMRVKGARQTTVKNVATAAGLPARRTRLP